MSTQRVYLVGAGAIARSHAGTAESMDESIDLRAADPNPAARETFSEEYPDATVFEDAETMLDEPAREDDVVVVATPPFVHHGPTIQALESGRHTLCEKPLALSAAEAEEMLAVAREHDRLLGSPTCRTHAPETDAVAELVADGAIGEPYHVTWRHKNPRTRPGIEYQPESKWFLDRSKSGGGPIMDWGPYDAYQLSRLLEPAAVEARHAWTAQPKTDVDPTDVTADVEYHAGASLRYERDGRAVDVTYERSWCTHGEPGTHFEIEGTEGAIKWSWLGWQDDEDVVLATDDDGERVTEPVEVTADARDEPLTNFLRAIRGEDAPIVTGADAVFNISVLHAIYDCAESDDVQRVVRD